MNTRAGWTLWGLGLLVAVLALLFVFFDAQWDFAYLIPHRLLRLGAMVVGGLCVALSSIVFQTLTGNRMLTPAVMGYEAVYLLWQAALLLVAGTQGLLVLGVTGSFALSAVLMLAYSWGVQRWLLRRSGHTDVALLLLFGLVLTMVISTLTQFIQFRISPGDFALFQGLSYATFNRVQPQTLLMAAMVLLPVCLLLRRTLPVLDVLALGREQAISLGISHARMLRWYLALIALLAAVSTALIGPLAFMGIFVANLAYALSHSHQHRVLLPLGCAIALAVFLLGQLLVEQVFNYRTSVSILVNLLCGAYFLALLMRKRSLAV